MIILDGEIRKWGGRFAHRRVARPTMRGSRAEASPRGLTRLAQHLSRDAHISRLPQMTLSRACCRGQSRLARDRAHSEARLIPHTVRINRRPVSMAFSNGCRARNRSAALDCCAQHSRRDRHRGVATDRVHIHCYITVRSESFSACRT